MRALAAVLLFLSVSAFAQVHVENAWARATAPGAQVAGGYMTLRNAGSAADRLVGQGRFGTLATLLAGAPHTQAADALWNYLATPDRLRDKLAAPSVDFAAVEGLALRLGEAAAVPLLDYLEKASDKTSRARTLKVLVAIGPAVLPPAAARFAGAPWYVQRNILVLHRSLNAWPASFSPITCTVHPHPQVRREAYKLLLDHPQHRASALSYGLRDADDGMPLDFYEPFNDPLG